jgi:transcriptional regulator with XRE-family HTH domain
MLYLAENLKKYRIMKDFTQEDIADYLNISPQSVSKWERGETYPDITLLPALANIFETSIDLLIGMDTVRAAKARYNIHKRANELMRNNQLDAAENVYRDALLMRQCVQRFAFYI